jgi:hypothetical protein
VNVAGSMDDIWLSFKNKNWSDVKPVNVAESMDDILFEAQTVAKFVLFK